MTSAPRDPGTGAKRRHGKTRRRSGIRELSEMAARSLVFLVFPGCCTGGGPPTGRDLVRRERLGRGPGQRCASDRTRNRGLLRVVNSRRAPWTVPVTPWRILRADTFGDGVTMATQPAGGLLRTSALARAVLFALCAVSPLPPSCIYARDAPRRDCARPTAVSIPSRTPAWSISAFASRARSETAPRITTPRK